MVICSVEPPGLVSVIMVRRLVVPTPCAENAIGVLGDRVTAAGVTPVRLTVWVVPGAPLLSSVKMRVAVRVPLAVGVNVTLHVQVPLVCATVTLFPHVVPAGAMAKSPKALPGAPIVTAPLAARCRALFPELVSVPPIGALDVFSA